MEHRGAGQRPSPRPSHPTFRAILLMAALLVAIVAIVALAYLSASS
jgi:hypothetical protein